MAEYGLKGLCAYADHAHVGGGHSAQVDAAVLECLAFLAQPLQHSLEDALSMCLKIGEAGVVCMDLLSGTHKRKLGTPEPTSVECKPQEGKCVLISGHDLFCLKSLLKATDGAGINVYTHGEMLPAHGYPELKKKHPQLVGHYGGAWNRQWGEFKRFPGPIVMTSNCLTEPLPKYKDRLFTFGPVGWPGCVHLGGEIPADSVNDKLWEPVVQSARENDGFSKEDSQFTYPAVSKDGQPSPKDALQMTGFGHDAVLGVAGTVLQGIETGAISRFHVIGGCDGDEREREYFTKLASLLPKDSVVLTLGCGKFRISSEVRASLGEIGDTGIPRVLDLGQCNDTISAVHIATALAGALKCEVSELPISITLCWLEQKAILVLLSCMHLGLKPIRVGPTLPSFVTEDVLNVMVNNFGIKVCGDPQKDIDEMIAQKGMS